MVAYNDVAGGRLPSTWLHAPLLSRRDWAEGLVSLVFDCDLGPYRAGQFARVGVDVDGERLWRAYSLASAPGEPLELLVVAVEGGALSPLLCRLEPGESAWARAPAAGRFTLEEVKDAQSLWLVATGTGLAPFISMLRTPEPWSRFGRIVVVHGCRKAEDLAYADELTGLGAKYEGQLVCIPVLSREERGDSLHGRIPAALDDGRLEARAGVTIEPGRAQVLLCGNPAMIEDVTVRLTGRGLRPYERRGGGDIHAERYWVDSGTELPE